MNNILIDSGFWYALFNERDEHYKTANKLFGYLDKGMIIIPFPSLYETINTRFSKRIDHMIKFEKIIERQNVVLLDDSSYKNSALKNTFAYSFKSKNISLVDMIIRLIILDQNINYLLTFNKKDFIDICLKRRVSILPE